MSPALKKAQRMPADGEAPLLFSSWRSWYLLVIGVLALIILGLAWVTQAFR